MFTSPGDGRPHGAGLHPRQRHAEVRERQSEDRVLEFDHFEEDAQAGHGSYCHLKPVFRCEGQGHRAIVVIC